MGFNITFPRANLGFLSKSDLCRSIAFDIPSIDTISRKYSNWQEHVTSTYKTPFNIDLGVEFDVSQSTTLFGKVAWFSAVDKYPMIEAGNSNSDIASNIDEIDSDFDRSAFDLENDFYPGISYWDIYHISGGVIWTNEKFDLCLGISYSIGRDNSLPQIINLSDPVEEDYFFGKKDYSATARYNQISIYFGFTYFFPRM